MKKVLTVAAVAEVATGMALLIVPSLVERLLLGAACSVLVHFDHVASVIVNANDGIV